MLIEKTIESVIKLVPQTIAEILNGLEKEIALTTKDRLDLNLILEEAITNAIRHGNLFDSARNVKVRLESKGDLITIHVKDEGGGFDHKKIPDNIKSVNEQMKSGGRGLFLILKTADHMTFNNSGSEICITKKVHPQKIP